MKKTTILLATVALSCCGISSSSAQNKINWNTGQPRLTSHLVSMQSEVTENDANAPAAKEVIGNPFDLFSDEASAPSPADVQHGQPAAEVDATNGDPASLPVGRHHRLRNQNQASVDYSMIEGIPAASLAPVIWCQSTCTPNPVAEVMLRQDCNVQDLWAGYPGARAQECAEMWNRIAGHQHCGCQVAAPACQACPQGVRNRYTQTPAACDRTARHVPANVAFSHVR